MKLPQKGTSDLSDGENTERHKGLKVSQSHIPDTGLGFSGSKVPKVKFKGPGERLYIQSFPIQVL